MHGEFADPMSCEFADLLSVEIPDHESDAKSEHNYACNQRNVDKGKFIIPVSLGNSDCFIFFLFGFYVSDIFSRYTMNR